MEQPTTNTEKILNVLTQNVDTKQKQIHQLKSELEKINQHIASEKNDLLNLSASISTRTDSLNILYEDARHQLSDHFQNSELTKALSGSTQDFNQIKNDLNSNITDVTSKEDLLDTLIEEKAQLQSALLTHSEELAQNEQALEKAIEIKENINIEISDDFELVESKTKEGLIYYTITPKTDTSVSDEANNLWSRIDRCRFVIFACKSMKFDEKQVFLSKLKVVMDMGLVGEKLDLSGATQRLNRLEEEILLYKSSRIRNRFLISHLGVAAGYGLLGVLISLYLGTFPSTTAYQIYPIVWTGSMIGAWLIITSRKMELDFSELVEMEKEKLAVFIKFLFIGASATLFLLFLTSGIIEISIAPLAGKSLSTSIDLQLLLGILIGALEGRFVTDLFTKTSQLIS